jgi:hypothetical protein
MIAVDVVRELAVLTRRRSPHGDSPARDALDIAILVGLGLAIGFLVVGLLLPWLETGAFTFGPLQMAAALAVIVGVLANFGLRASLRATAVDRDELRQAADRVRESALLAEHLLKQRVSSVTAIPMTDESPR